MTNLVNSIRLTLGLLVYSIRLINGSLPSVADHADRPRCHVDIIMANFWSVCVECLSSRHEGDSLRWLRYTGALGGVAGRGPMRL